MDTGSEHAIIDITGVPAVDTQVAQHLLKTVVVAARLMGAECIISGIRPADSPQLAVALGIEFGDIATKATLADALVLALRQSGVAVQGREGRVNGSESRSEALASCLWFRSKIDLEDQTATALQEDLSERISVTGARWCSRSTSPPWRSLTVFVGKMLSTIASVARVLDAETVVVGMRPAVAITLVELGLSLGGVVRPWTSRKAWRCSVAPEFDQRKRRRMRLSFRAQRSDHRRPYRS